MARGATPTSSNLLRLCQLHTACKTAWNDAYSPLFTMEAAALKERMNRKESQQRRYTANKWPAEGRMAASRRRVARSGPSSSLSPWFACLITYSSTVAVKLCEDAPFWLLHSELDDSLFFCRNRARRACVVRPSQLQHHLSNALNFLT